MKILFVNDQNLAKCKYSITPDRQRRMRIDWTAFSAIKLAYQWLSLLNPVMHLMSKFYILKCILICKIIVKKTGVTFWKPR